MGVSLAEKERNYTEAVTVLRALLQGSACPGRRGKFACTFAFVSVCVCV